jgi:hypothetical protein
MLRLLESGIVAARAQALVVMLIAAILLAASAAGEPDPGIEERFGDPSLLKWIFLAAAAFTAVGFRKSLSCTAARVARETNLATHGRGRRLRMGLLLNLRLATAAMAVLTVTPPPDLLLRALEPLLEPGVAALGWAGAMSIGVAYFGAGARSASLSLRPGAASAQRRNTC